MEIAKKTLLALGFIFFALINPGAQELDRRYGESARIYHIAGSDIAITLQGGQVLYRADSIRGEGIFLERSGIVHSGPGTSLEIQLLPSGTVIKLSENTSLAYNGLDEGGISVELGLLYGRIRVVSGNGVNSTGTSSLIIRSAGVSTRIGAGADIGVDHYMEQMAWTPTLRPAIRVYAFRGGAEVFSNGTGVVPTFFGNFESLTVGVRECLLLNIVSSYTYAEKTQLDKGIIDYWRHHYFAGIAPRPMPDTSIADDQVQKLEVQPVVPIIIPVEIPEPQQVIEKVLIYEPADLAGERQSTAVSYTRKNVTLAVGLTLTVASLVAQGILYDRYVSSPDKKNQDLYYMTYPVLASGLVITLAGILYNPQTARK